MFLCIPFRDFLKGKEMANKEKEGSPEEVKQADLSLSNLLPKSLKEMENILDSKEALKQIAKDARHVQVLIYHMLRFNVKAIDEFNKSSNRISKVLIFLSIAMTVVALVHLVVTVLGK